MLSSMVYGSPRGTYLSPFSLHAGNLRHGPLQAGFRVQSAPKKRSDDNNKHS